MVSEYLQRDLRDRLAIARDLSRTYGSSWPIMSTIADGLEVMFAVTQVDAASGTPVFVHVSSHARALTGYWPTELVGKDPNFLRESDADPAVGRIFMETLVQYGEAEMRVLNHRKNGDVYGCQILGITSPVLGPEQQPQFFAFLAECNPTGCQ